jgi:hypothetical protein
MILSKCITTTFVLALSVNAFANDSAAPAQQPTPSQAQPADTTQDAQKPVTDSASSTSSSEFNCAMDKAKRTVKVAYEKEGAKVPCKVNYVRDASAAEEKTIYSAAAEEGYCEKKASEFVEKLKSNGWTCTNP